MLRGWTTRAAALAFLLSGWAAIAQVANGDGHDTEDYKLKLAVDEVVLTFHASNAHGMPINDLKREEIRLRDNGEAPRRIVAFEVLTNRPMRAGILLDTSDSMQRALGLNKAIAEQYVKRLFRQQSDVAFVGDFGYASEISQAWTNDSSVLSRGIRDVREGRMNSVGGTALFDAIFRVCFYQFGKLDPASTGNFILLFS